VLARGVSAAATRVKARSRGAAVEENFCNFCNAAPFSPLEEANDLKRLDSGKGPLGTKRAGQAGSDKQETTL
jgi:hypothetical protein